MKTSSGTNRDSRLVETIPASIVSKSWKNHIIWIGVPVAFFCLTLSIITYCISGWMDAMFVSLIFGILPVILVFGIASGMHRNLTTQVPTVELANDEITVRYGNRVIRERVAMCHLHRGSAMYLRLIGGVRLYSLVQVILIDFPPSRNSAFGNSPFWNSIIGTRSRRRNTVAVGYTVEMRDKWESALLQCSAKSFDETSMN